jgi:hypothetical protein
MTNEQDSLSVTYETVRKVFGSTRLIEQQRPGLNFLLDRAINRNKPNPVPEIEIVGIYEMVTQHAWDSAFTVLSGNSKASPTASSTASESPERKSTASASPAQQMPRQLYDLQNLPEDPALGAIRAGEAARRNRESSLLAQVEVAVFPEVLPKSARLIARAEWTVSRARSTVQSYLLSSNQQRSHWVLWVRRWDAESRKWSAAEVQCGIPRKGSTAAQAAITLMSALWRRERWDSDLGRVDACWPGRLLGTGGLDELVDNVWPRDEHEHGGSHGHGCR